jgi:hypothetical protein
MKWNTGSKVGYAANKTELTMNKVEFERYETRGLLGWRYHTGRSIALC